MREQLKKIGNGILAAVTSPEAITAEKSIAALIVIRVVIAVGGTAATADIIKLALGL